MARHKNDEFEIGDIVQVLDKGRSLKERYIIRRLIWVDKSNDEVWKNYFGVDGYYMARLSAQGKYDNPQVQCPVHSLKFIEKSQEESGQINE